MAKLEKWSLVGFDGTRPLAVRGEVHGDERFADGTWITSSRLLFLDADGHIAMTRNHTYELGAISDAFGCWMAEHGRTLARYGAVIAAKVKSTRATVTHITTRPARATEETTELVSDVPTTVVQEPTLIVAAG